TGGADRSASGAAGDGLGARQAGDFNFFIPVQRKRLPFCVLVVSTGSRAKFGFQPGRALLGIHPKLDRGSLGNCPALTVVGECQQPTRLGIERSSTKKTAKRWRGD